MSYTRGTRAIIADIPEMSTAFSGFLKNLKNQYSE